MHFHAPPFLKLVRKMWNIQGGNKFTKIIDGKRGLPKARLDFDAKSEYMTKKVALGCQVNALTRESQQQEV